MYKLIILILISCSQLSGQVALPEEMSSPRQRADRMTKEMTIKLDLFTHQVPFIDSLNFIYAVEMQEKVFSGDSGVWGQYRQGSEIMNRKDIELKKYLPPIQYKKYEEFKSEVLWEIMGKIF